MPTRLFRYVWPQWRGLSIVVATMLVAIGTELLRPWPLKLLVDSVLGQAPLPPSVQRLLAMLPGGPTSAGLLVWACVGTVLIFLAHALSALVSTRAAVMVGQRMTYELSADMFTHLQRLSVLFHSRRPVGDTISRVAGDPYCIQEFVTGVLVPLGQSVITLLAMALAMWRLEPQMTLIALAAAPLMVMSIWLFGSRMRETARVRRDLEGEMMTVLEQTLNAMPAIQAYTREELEDARFRRLADRTVVAYRRSTEAEMWFKLSVGLVTACGTAGLMWLGARSVMEGRTTVGTILVFLTYLASLYEPLNSMTYTASTLQIAAANADRVIEILDTPADVTDSAHASDVRLRGKLAYDQVTFEYESGRAAVRDVSFRAEPGEVIAVVGPSGAGKSTLANLLVRFFDPSSGRVMIDDHDIRELKIRSLRRQVAIVLQDTFIFPVSAAENIAYGRPEATRDEIIAAAKQASAHDFISNLEQGYDTVIGERGTTLSGGEKQRLSLARAFLKDAPILILDEPTSALDANTETMLLDALRLLMRGRTTLVVAHRLSTIRAANRILVMEGGAIIESGTHQELLESAGLYASLYRQQMNLAGDVARHDKVNADASIDADGAAVVAR